MYQDKVRTKIEENCLIKKEKERKQGQQKLTPSSSSYLTSGNLAKDYL